MVDKLKRQKMKEKEGLQQRERRKRFKHWKNTGGPKRYLDEFNKQRIKVVRKNQERKKLKNRIKFAFVLLLFWAYRVIIKIKRRFKI